MALLTAAGVIAALKYGAFEFVQQVAVILVNTEIPDGAKPAMIVGTASIYVVAFARDACTLVIKYLKANPPAFWTRFQAWLQNETAI